MALNARDIQTFNPLSRAIQYSKNPRLGSSRLQLAQQLITAIYENQHTLTIIDDAAIRKFVFATAGFLIDQSQLNSTAEEDKEAEIISVLLTAIQQHHPSTARHQRSVKHLALAIGDTLGLDKTLLFQLGQAAALHDIGKLGVPCALLDRRGTFQPGESEMVKQGHLLYSYYLLLAIPFLREAAGIVAYNHGADGYTPAGIPSDLGSAPIEAQILSLADAYTALTEGRQYRKGRKDSPKAIITRRPYKPELLRVARLFCSKLC
ncbi:MAG: HD domain-containing phosphohydrolase [Candidatus Margulisiibacteriota bacterium]